METRQDTEPTVGAQSERARIRRHPERARPEQAEEILSAGRVAHVGFATGGQPYVIPLTYHYEEGIIYLHSAPAGRLARTLAEGTEVCVEVTLLDGLVASRDAKSHSMNYRTVVAFGRAQVVRDLDEKRRVFERMTERYFPGRAAGVDYIPATDGHLRAVELLAVRVVELSGKARSGPPLGAHDADEDSPYSGYVVVLPGVDA